MLNKKKYLIKTHRNRSAVQNDEKTIEFEFSNLDGKQTIKFESQIGNFFEYENQLRIQLDKLNFKARPWIKNSMYFSIPNNLHEVQMRCFFDSADHVGAIESFLLKENIAILLTPELKSYNSKSVFIVSLFETKLEFAIIENLEFKHLKTLYSDKEIMNEISDLTKVVNKNVGEIENKFRIDERFLISDCEIRKLSGFKRIDNHHELILKGLRIAAKTNIDQLYNRLKM